MWKLSALGKERELPALKRLQNSFCVVLAFTKDLKIFQHWEEGERAK